MTKYFLVKQEDKFYYSDVSILDPSSLKLIEHPIREKIIKLLYKKPMYPVEIAKELRLHEQKVYYHIKQLQKSGILEVVSKKEIRGTIAKKYAPKTANYAISLAPKWKPMKELTQEETKISRFLDPFVKSGELNANIIVGSPDPHGPFKARARDGHYAIELALFLGATSSEFSTKLDVDANLDNNLIVVGGPVTNLVCSKLNEHMSVRFSEKRPWGIISKTKTYTDDNAGLIVRMPNPFNPEYSILVFAGIRYTGTKAAVMALTKNSEQVLNRYSGQKVFSCVVQSYDMDGDGKLDSVEILE